MNLPHIKNAFEHIQTACCQKLQELYPHGIPKLAQERYDKELSFLQNSDCLDDFEIYRLLSNEAKKCCQYFILRGTVSGSYLIYLMGSGRFNPLPAHYYCPVCGYFETIDTHLYGIDLPEAPCPVCGNTMLGDGFHLSSESVWGTDGKKAITFDYTICEEFRPFAKQVLTHLYPENPIVPCGILTSSSAASPFDPTSFEISHGGFIILPTGHSIDDYPAIKTYLEDGEPCLSGQLPVLESHSLKRITLLPHSYMDCLITLQRKHGIYASEIGIAQLRELTYHDLINSRTLTSDEQYFFLSEQPKTYFEMLACHISAHNSFAGIDYSCDDRCEKIKKTLLDTPEYQKYPCSTREDFFDYLVESGICVQDAFQTAELIRKGLAKRISASDTLPIPEELIRLARRYVYIFPKAHALEYLLLSARLAYFMKQDSRIYSKIVFKKK